MLPEATGQGQHTCIQDVSLIFSLILTLSQQIILILINYTIYLFINKMFSLLMLQIINFEFLPFSA